MAYVLDPFALTSLENAKEHIGISPSVTTYDNILIRMINASTDKIELYCDRKFKQRNYPNAIISVNSQSNTILLPQWPCFKPTELWIDSTYEYTNPDFKLPLSDYDLLLSARGEGIGIELKSVCTCAKRIKVVYDAGYSPIPASLEDACINYVQFMYEMRNNNSVGISSKSKNQENISYADDIPVFIMKSLDQFKRFDFVV